jgi:hypothetical protein
LENTLKNQLKLRPEWHNVRQGPVLHESWEKSPRHIFATIMKMGASP